MSRSIWELLSMNSAWNIWHTMNMFLWNHLYPTFHQFKITLMNISKCIVEKTCSIYSSYKIHSKMHGNKYWIDIHSWLYIPLHCKQWGIIPLPPGTLRQFQPLVLGLDSLVQAWVSQAGGYLGTQTTQIGATSNLINIYWQITSYYSSIHGYRSQVPLTDTHRQS